ncbi:MAG: N-acetylglucosamine-6-phosphate deacetylase [Eubacteriales bacterium]
MKTRIIGGKVYNTEKCAFEERTLYFDDVICGKGIALKTIDAGGAYVLPGFIDLHTHGRMGIDIMNADVGEMNALAIEYAKTGVTALYPTVMTAPLEKIYAAIENIVNAKGGARFAGIHVEGPYIDGGKRGCHTESFIREPDFEEIADIMEKIAPLHAHFTIAPEHDNKGEGVIHKIVRNGGSVGIGHTSADAETVRRALADGAISFTHTFNAMSPFRHREPGASGMALATSAFAEFICDGIHLAPETVEAAYNAKLRFGDKFVLITDSIPAAGLPDGDYDMNGIPFKLQGKKACTEAGIIVGSALDIPTAILNLMKFCDIPLEKALLCATKAPAEMAGIYDKTGSLAIGKSADIIICDENLHIEKTIVAGNIVYERKN